MLGHDAPIDPFYFPIAPFDFQLLNGPSIREIFGVFDRTSMLESTALVPERKVKICRQYDGFFGLRMNWVLDIEALCYRECLIYGVISRKERVLFTDVDDHRRPLEREVVEQFERTEK